MDRRFAERIETCIHEASHGYAAWSMSLPVLSVQVAREASEGVLGEARIELPLTPEELMGAHQRNPFAAVHRMKQVLAVYQAGGQACGRSLGGGDLLEVRRWARAWGDVEDYAAATLPRALQPCRWRDIRAEVTARVDAWLAHAGVQDALSGLTEHLVYRSAFVFGDTWATLCTQYPRIPIIAPRLAERPAPRPAPKPVTVKPAPTPASAAVSTPPQRYTYHIATGMKKQVKMPVGPVSVCDNWGFRALERAQAEERRQAAEEAAKQRRHELLPPVDWMTTGSPFTTGGIVASS